MATRLNVPSIVGLNVEGIPFGMVVFLQAVQDALNTVDQNVVYKDTVNINVASPRIRALSSQGQSFSVSGVNLASGDDFAAMRRDMQTMLEDNLALRETVATLVSQLQGK